jgi:hypothetical protein
MDHSLSGRWFVESMDGVRVEMGPGEISFGEDQNTRQVDGKRGHLSGTLGPEPAVLMLVQFKVLPTIASACAAEKPDELAPFHSITSSARASRVGGISSPSALAVLRLMAR